MADDLARQDDQPLASFQPEGGIGGSLAVRSATARIGQGPQNDIIIDDDTVSTQHARLEYSDGGWRLIDLNSRNGTYVDGVRITPEVATPLRESAAIAFGAVNLTFQARVDVEPDTLVATGPRDEASAQVRRAGFRLPVWLVLLVIIIASILVFAFLSMGGEAPPSQPANVESTAFLIWSTYQSVFV